MVNRVGEALAGLLHFGWGRPVAACLEKANERRNLLDGVKVGVEKLPRRGRLGEATEGVALGLGVTAEPSHVATRDDRHSEAGGQERPDGLLALGTVEDHADDIERIGDSCAVRIVGLLGWRAKVILEGAQVSACLSGGDCPEPAEICTFTGRPRGGTLFRDLAARTWPGFVMLVLRSRQLAPGLGGYRGRELLGLEDLARESAGPLLVATACRCHGVLHGLRFV